MGDLQVHVSADECYEAAALASQPYGELLRTPQPRLSMARRVPAGVVGVIAPFNVPTILSIRSVAPALALGNAVILKPDPRTSVSGGVAAGRDLRAGPACPTACCTCCPAARTPARRWSPSPDIRIIAFTGSTRAGRAVARLAGEHLKRVHLELGGNSALIVLDDVDVERATSVGAFGSFIHQGQICMSDQPAPGAQLDRQGVRLGAGRPGRAPAGRRPVHRPGRARAADRRAQRDNVHRIVTGSVDAGAALLTGGTYEGLFYRPTVLADVPTSAPAYAEEIFGPVAPVISLRLHRRGGRAGRRAPSTGCRSAS